MHSNERFTLILTYSPSFFEREGESIRTQWFRKPYENNGRKPRNEEASSSELWEEISIAVV